MYVVRLFSADECNSKSCAHLAVIFCCFFMCLAWSQVRLSMDIHINFL